MVHSFTFPLRPNHEANISFEVNANWENQVRIINDMDGSWVERGNGWGRNRDPLRLHNPTAGDQAITVVAGFKKNDHDIWRGSEGIIRNNNLVAGVGEIVYGFQDQPHAADDPMYYKNVIVTVRLSATEVQVEPV